MKPIWTLITLTLLTGCGVICNSKKNVKRTFIETEVEIYTDFDESIISKKPEKIFMPIVFNDDDSILYNQPITKTLQIDSTKEDVSIYRVLARDFTVVKLYRKQFDLIVENNKYKFDDAFKKAATEYNPGKAFLFITSNPNWYFYFARTLDSPKAEIHDIIWVNFGP